MKFIQIKILELRAKAENQLGNKFNIKKFHNTILESGCLPLFLLEERINEWISGMKNENV